MLGFPLVLPGIVQGLELAARPSILMLDEPTSGRDMGEIWGYSTIRLVMNSIIYIYILIFYEFE